MRQGAAYSAGHSGFPAAQKVAGLYGHYSADPSADWVVRRAASHFPAGQAADLIVRCFVAAHYLAGRWVDSPGRYSVAARYLAGRSVGSRDRYWAVAHCSAGLRSQVDCFAEHYFAARCSVAAWVDLRSAAEPGDWHCAEVLPPAVPQEPSSPELPAFVVEVPLYESGTLREVRLHFDGRAPAAAFLCRHAP